MPAPRLVRLAVGAAASAALVAATAPSLPLAGPAAAAELTQTTTALAVDERLGYDRIGVRRGGSWRLAGSLSGGLAESYAEETGGYAPVSGDTNGDGTGTVSLFKDGVWKLRDSARGPASTFRFGAPGDVPVLGDWNGDGIDTVGLFRRGRWLLRDANSAGPATAIGYGLPGDKPVVGDWDADGDSDIAVVRGNRWYQRDASTAGPSSRTFLFGIPGDLPVAGDWDHDGRDTPGVFRRGTWFLKQGNGFGSSQVAYFGRAGDRPVVRRTPDLAPGVAHRVLRRGSAVAHVATVDLAAASSPDAVLAAGRLLGAERTSSMARRTGAVVAVNGDYALPNGRPVHLFAADGRLVQTPQLLGRAVGLDAAGTTVQMGFPTLAASVTAPVSDTASATVDLPRWNAGRPSDDSFAAYTALGAELETPPDNACYAGIEPRSGPRVAADGTVQTAVTVTGTRCGGAGPVVTRTGITMAANSFHAGEAVIRALRDGGVGQLTTLLGFPGAVDAMGGNPLLLQGGQQQRQDFTGDSGFFGRNPRTALGVTADRKLLLVVVDGRQAGYSSGMTLQELADLMSDLGVRDAINLDGGGSSTMWLNGLVANRPSDPQERAVSSALVVLPGGDPGQADVTLGTAASLRGSGAAGPTEAPPADPRPHTGPDGMGVVRPAVPGWPSMAADPASTGGLADALADTGVDLPPVLAEADRAYDAARR